MGRDTETQPTQLALLAILRGFLANPQPQYTVHSSSYLGFFLTSTTNKHPIVVIIHKPMVIFHPI